MNKQVLFAVAVLSGCLLTYRYFHSAKPAAEPVTVIQEDMTPEPAPVEPLSKPIQKKAIQPAAKVAPERPKVKILAKEVSHFEIVRSIREDEYCNSDGKYKLGRELFTDEESRRLRIFTAFVDIGFHAKANDDVLTALLTKRRETALSVLENCGSVDCNFIKGLILTGQLSKIKGESDNPVKDMQTGLAYLRTLKFRNRDNSIFPYFMLWPLHELGQKFTLRQVFKDFLRAPRFSNPLTRTYVAMAQAGQLNATAHLYAEELGSALSVPEYEKAASVIKELIKDDDFRSELSPWAKNRVVDFDYINAKNLSAPIVLLVEVAQLKSLARVFWEKSVTPDPAPQIFSPEGFTEFMKLREHLEFDGSKYLKNERTPSTCLASWELKREIHTRYSQALSDMIRRWESP